MKLFICLAIFLFITQANWTLSRCCGRLIEVSLTLILLAVQTTSLYFVLLELVKLVW